MKTHFQIAKVQLILCKGTVFLRKMTTFALVIQRNYWYKANEICDNSRW